MLLILFSVNTLIDKADSEHIYSTYTKTLKQVL